MIFNTHYSLLFQNKVYTDTYIIDHWEAGSRMELSWSGDWISVYQNRADSGSNTVFYTKPLCIPNNAQILGMKVNFERSDRVGSTGTTYIINDVDDLSTEDPLRVEIAAGGGTAGTGAQICLEEGELDEDYFHWSNGQPLEIELEPLLAKSTISIRIIVTIIYSAMVYDNYTTHYRLTAWGGGYYSELRKTFYNLFGDSESTAKAGVQLMYAGRDIPGNCSLTYDTWNIPAGKTITSCKVTLYQYVCSKTTSVQIPFLNNKTVSLDTSTSTSPKSMEYTATAAELQFLNNNRTLSAYKQPSIVINNNSSPATFAIHDSYIDITYA